MAFSLGDILAQNSDMQPRAPRVRSARSQNRAAAWSRDLALWKEYRTSLARTEAERQAFEQEYAARMEQGPDFTGYHARSEFCEAPLHKMDERGKVRILRAFDEIRRWLWRNRTPHGQAVSRAYREVLSALCALAVRHGRVFPSYEKLASMACCSRSTVYRALQWLKAWGLLDWKRRLKRSATPLGSRVSQASNVYAIALKGLAAIGTAIFHRGPECHNRLPSNYTPAANVLRRIVGAAPRPSGSL